MKKEIKIRSTITGDIFPGTIIEDRGEIVRVQIMNSSYVVSAKRKNSEKTHLFVLLED